MFIKHAVADHGLAVSGTTGPVRRRSHLCCGALSFGLLLWVCLAAAPNVRAQSVNDGFDPDVNGIVWALAVQADGKTLVGGNFTLIDGSPHNHLARLNPDGTPDPDFAAADVNGAVLAIAVQSDGRILIGGAFSQVGAGARNHIARLNVDGSVDTGFNPNADDNVYALAVQPDGKVVAGGKFATVGGQPRQHLVRLNANGSVDAAFDPGANDNVLALAMQPHGGLIVGGHFTTIGGQPRQYIARLNADGSVDGTFHPDADDVVQTVALQLDGKLLIGGGFGMVGGQTRNRIARLNADGSVDGSFSADVDDYVQVLMVQADGAIVAGGQFGTVGGQVRHNIARLRPDGSVDASFDPVADNSVFALVQQPDGNLVAGGQFSTIGGQTRHRLARMNAIGSLDDTLDTVMGGDIAVVQALALQPDGKLLLGGNFNTIDGQPHNKIARLNADGSVDTAFNIDAGSASLIGVATLALQTDGKVVAGRDFITINGLTRHRIARFNADGTLDAAFDPDAGSYVEALALQPDGKLVVGGFFGTIGGQTHNHLARLNPDGSIDGTYNVDVNNTVLALAMQADGSLLIGGDFTVVNGQPHNHVARVDVDGNVDPTFAANADAAVTALVAQPDGNLVLGGAFSAINGQARNRIARVTAAGAVDAGFLANADAGVETLITQLDGKLLVGGEFTTINGLARPHLARLNGNGSVDIAFNPNPNNTVYALAMQADGKLVASGAFNVIGGQARNYIARFGTPTAALPSLDLISYGDGNMVVWTRAGAGPEPALPPQLLFSVDGDSYTSAGTMQHFSNGWSMTGFVPPANQMFYLRTRMRVRAGTRAVSGGVIESTHQFFVGHDHIFANGFDTVGAGWNFDDVTAPALPMEFSTETSGSGVPWITVTDFSDSAPNAAFSSDEDTTGDASLTTPSFRPASPSILSFVLRFNTERGYDGIHLEIAVDGGAFQEFTAAGGRLLLGGYNGVLNRGLSCASAPNPLGDGPAWTGLQETFMQVIATLPQAAVGHDVRVRWRMGNDCSFTADAPAGVWVDTIAVTAQEAISAR